LAFNGLHGAISQKTELFTTTAVRTSNPTYEAPHYAGFFIVVLIRASPDYESRGSRLQSNPFDSYLKPSVLFAVTPPK
jgi:hypothetical protein